MMRFLIFAKIFKNLERFELFKKINFSEILQKKDFTRILQGSYKKFKIVSSKEKS